MSTTAINTAEYQTGWVQGVAEANQVDASWVSRKLAVAQQFSAPIGSWAMGHRDGYLATLADRLAR